MEHTKGPWHYEGETQTRFDTMTGIKSESITHWIKFDNDKYSNICLMISSRSKEEIEANARLIAAAPCMLGALELVLETCSRGPCKTIKDEYGYPNDYVSTSDIKSIVSDAIKKAKGES